MSNEAIATLVGLIIANWVSIGPIFYKAVKLAWEKSIEWQKMLERLDRLEKRVDKNETDITNAHVKLRDTNRPPNR